MSCLISSSSAEVTLPPYTLNDTFKQAGSQDILPGYSITNTPSQDPSNVYQPRPTLPPFAPDSETKRPVRLLHPTHLFLIAFVPFILALCWSVFTVYASFWVICYVWEGVRGGVGEMHNVVSAILATIAVLLVRVLCIYIGFGMDFWGLKNREGEKGADERA